MLIITPAKLSIDRWLKESARCALYALGALVVGLTLLYVLPPWRADGGVAQYSRPLQQAGRAGLPYEAIGSGALALRPQHALGWVSRLAEELVLVAYNSRPDAPVRDAEILLALKNGKEQLALASGHTLYLKESERGRGLLSSDVATALWVKPLLLDNGAVLVEAGRVLGQGAEEKGQFIVAQQGGVPPRYQLAGRDYAKEMKAARGFSRDQLVAIYGGREYAPWKEKVVLELANGTDTYACFVSAGDHLLYEGKEWRVAAFEDLRGDLPIARVRAVHAGAVEMDVWDETGFCPLQVRVEMEKQAPMQRKSEGMPTHIRLRNSTQVSCALGKRRVILRQGDWLLKTASGWRNLRRADEIDQYLNRRLKGELFVFDALEKEQGHFVVKGYLFDETRTAAQALALPIESEKSQGKSSRKRRAA